MAKAKKKPLEDGVPTPDADKAVRNALAEIRATYGAGVVSSGQDYLDKPRQVISLGPAFDLAIGGGIPSGHWVSVSGPEGCAKTATMMSFLANCQREKFGGRPCMVLSAEHRMSVAILKGTRGLNREEPHLTIIESEEGRILTSKDFLNIGLTFLKSVPGGVLLIDSVSALVNPQVIEGGLGTSDFGAGNKLVSQFVDLAAPVVRANDNIVIGIVQFYANTSKYGGQWNEKAAKHWKYQSDLSIVCKKTAPIFADGEDRPATGQEQEWLVKKCAFARPAGTLKSVVKYGVGIDRVGELFALAHGFGLVTGSGWYTFDFLADRPELFAGTEADRKGEAKVQGRDNAISLLESRPDWVDHLEGRMAPFLAPDEEVALAS